MPGVQVHADDGALAEPRGEACLVTLVMEEAWGQREVLALPQLLGAPDGRRAAAVLHVEADLPVVTAQQGGRGLVQVIPDPVEICESERPRLSPGPPGGPPPTVALHSHSSSSPQRQSRPRWAVCRLPQKASLWLSQSQKDSPVTGTALGMDDGPWVNSQTSGGRDLGLGLQRTTPGPGAQPATATMDTSSGLLLKGRPRGSFLGMESRALEAQWLISPWQGCTLSHPSRSRAPRSRIHRGARGKARH
ncbi:TPA: hypothetical protein BOS_22537 [Bos taurus]|nr:TPA: hypothetical protein BOS_22537 [Bos taurus]